MSLTDDVGLTDGLSLKARHGNLGEVKPFRHVTTKREWSPTRQCYEEVTRVFDHDDDTYTEVYRDLHTGAVTFEKSGLLSDQTIHGPRRSKRPQPPRSI